MSKYPNNIKMSMQLLTFNYYFSYLVAVLRSCCFACNRLLAKDYESHVLALQLRAVRMGYVACAQVRMDFILNINSTLHWLPDLTYFKVNSNIDL